MQGLIFGKNEAKLPLGSPLSVLPSLVILTDILLVSMTPTFRQLGSKTQALRASNLPKILRIFITREVFYLKLKAVGLKEFLDSIFCSLVTSTCAFVQQLGHRRSLVGVLGFVTLCSVT